MLLNCSVGEDSRESLGLQGDQTSQSFRKSVLDIHWKDWGWSRSSNNMATWCKELTHWKRPWCWERLKVDGEGDDREWDGRMASLTQWTWVWANSGRCGGQGSLAWCSLWVHKESATEKQQTRSSHLIWTLLEPVHTLGTSNVSHKRHQGQNLD